MGRAKQLIIAEREESNMVSSWTEYLVLERRAKTKDWRLFVGKYEALAEAGKHQIGQALVPLLASVVINVLRPLSLLASSSPAPSHGRGHRFEPCTTHQ